MRFYKFLELCNLLRAEAYLKKVIWLTVNRVRQPAAFEMTPLKERHLADRE